LNVEKNLLLAKQTQVYAEKTRGPGIKVTQKMHEKKNEMLPVAFVGSLNKTHAVLYSNIADVHEIEVRDVRTLKFVYSSENFPIIIVHHDCL